MSRALDIRQRYVDLALSYVGCNASPASRERYLDLVSIPTESAATKAAMTTSIDPKTGFPGQSGCALVIRGLLRKLGLQHHLLLDPYVNGHAVQDLWVIGHEAGAIFVPKDPSEVFRGDIVCVGDNAAHGTEHVYSVTAEMGSTVTAEGDHLDSVDGGQRLQSTKPGERWETIEGKFRSWVKHPDGWWDKAHNASDPGGMFGALRKVEWVIHLDQLHWPGEDDLPTTDPAPTPRNDRLMRTIQEGDTNDDVAVWQDYLGLKADRIFGPKTKAGTISFQALHGLPMTGIVDEATWDAAGFCGS